MRTLLAFVFVLTSKLLTGQGLFFNEIWPSDRSAGMHSSLLIECPYLTDTYRLVGSSSFRKNKFTLLFEGNWLYRASFSHLDATFWTGHRVTEDLALFAGATIQSAHSVEVRHLEWQATLGMEIKVHKIEAMVLAYNIIPYNNSELQEPFRLQVLLKGKLGRTLRLNSRIMIDDYKLPQIDLQISYDLNETWSLHPVLNLWPIRIGLGISCHVSAHWTGMFGSRYDIRLGPTPIIGGVYD